MRAVLDADPVAACMVAARVEVAGLDPWRLGGELWACRVAGSTGCASPARTWCPLRGERSALRSFADRARRHGRGCSSLVGPRRAGAAAVGRAGRALGAGPRGARRPAADGARRAAGGARPTRSCARCAPTSSTATCRPRSPCSPRRSASTRGPATAGRATGRGSPSWSRPAGRSPGSRATRWCSRPRSARCPRRSGRSRASGCTRTAAATAWAPPAPPRSADRLAAMGRVSSLYVNGFNHVARAAYTPDRLPPGRQLRHRPVLTPSRRMRHDTSERRRAGHTRGVSLAVLRRRLAVALGLLAAVLADAAAVAVRTGPRAGGDRRRSSPPGRPATTGPRPR